MMLAHIYIQKYTVYLYTHIVHLSLHHYCTLDHEWKTNVTSHSLLQCTVMRVKDPLSIASQQCYSEFSRQYNSPKLGEI